MAKYLIKLFPIDRYFFGGDITFGTDNTNYFVRSEYFPQQTTLLGMLRYYILQQNNMLDKNGKVIKDKEAELIGPKSFDATKVSEISNFGIIKNLSPVFITSPEGEYFVQSREYGLQWQEDEVSGEKKRELIPLKLRKRKGSNNFSEKEICYFEGYNSKIEIPELLVNARTGNIRYFDYKDEMKNDPMNGVFIPNEQIGIRLPKNSKERSNKEKGFYRQIGYTMPSEYGFAFYADIEKDKKIFKSGSSLIRMGADQSWFRMEIIGETSENVTIGDYYSLTTNLFRKVNNFNEKVVLLSDCFIDRIDYDKYLYASVATVPFRYIEMIKEDSTQNPNNHQKVFHLKGANIKSIKSIKYRTLLKKGSVLYVENEIKKLKLINNITSNKAFNQIGYNHAI